MYPSFPFNMNTVGSPYAVPQIPQLQTQSIQYVNNRASAESFQMLPNTSIVLMDANLPRFYLKQTDASGISTIKAYDFKEVEEDKPTEYVTKSEFENFKAEVKGGNAYESVDDARKREQRHDDASVRGYDEGRKPADFSEKPSQY